tara:strand:+ start:157 stop:342 length:186 start_codon:yes stop_codon:yes gene_type:complete
MNISERTKRLLTWWQLRIEKSREELKEKNVKRNDTVTDSTAGVCLGSEDKQRQSIEGRKDK